MTLTNMVVLAQFIAGTRLAVGGLFGGVGKNGRFGGFFHPVLRIGATPVGVELGFHAAVSHRILIAVEGVARDKPISLQARDTLPNSVARFNRPILWRMTF